jgi:hypothetical protein
VSVSRVTQMNWLDCSDLDTALSSVADIVGVNALELRRAIVTYDESRFNDYSEDPYVRMPREVLADLGRDLDSASIDGAYFFHGTRLIDLQGVRQAGLFPLDQMVERIWSMLFELVNDVCGESDWERVRADLEAHGGDHDGWLYRTKTRDTASSFGPFAVLVREVLFNSGDLGNHSYLDCPEVVQDIARAFERSFRIDAEERFRAASHPVIVKFGNTMGRVELLRPALWYVFTMVRDGEVTSNANGGFDGKGSAVVPEDIVSIEIVDFSP